MKTIGFRRRFVAFFIDGLILSVLLALIFLISTAILGLSLESDETEDTIFALVMTGLILPFFYFVYFHGSTGQTPGKRLLKIQVVGVSEEDMTFGSAFLRWVGYIISALPLFAGFVWIIFDGKKQGWHDKIARTLVITQKRKTQIEFDFIRKY